jgi:leucyl aminopeptidase (aminopeptidase T)
MPEVTQDDLTRAAVVLVSTVLHVKDNDRFVIVYDATTSEIASLVAQVGEGAGALVTLAPLDQLKSVSTNHSGERPHKVLPDALRRALLAAQVSVYLATEPHAELPMREQLSYLVGACGVRHAHLPGISKQGFCRGLALDASKIEQWGRGMGRLVELARVLDAESPAGTRLRVHLGKASRWSMHLGVLHPGKMGRLPAGALYATPESAEGTFVANASIGEFFGAREGLLLQTPVRFTIADGKVTAVDTTLAGLKKELEHVLSMGPNSDRVGLVTLGVNAGIAMPTGEASVDENLPGLHLVIGDPGGRVAGLDWTARTSFAACGSGGRLLVDGTLAIEDGKIVHIA